MNNKRANGLKTIHNRHNTVKRAFSLLLALVLVAALGVPTFATSGANVDNTSRQHIDLVYRVVVIVVSAVGVLVGGYSLFKGCTEDDGESKARGSAVLVGTGFLVVVLVAAKAIFGANL